MATTMIDIDQRPYVVAEVSGSVERINDEPQFHPDSPGRWATVLERCAGHEVRLRVIRQKRQRSHAANAFYWGVVLPDILSGLRELAESVGELPVFTDEDDLHEALKWTFLRRMYVLPGAGHLEAMPSSAKLSVAEFAEYISKVKQWAADRKIWIREPGEAIA